MLALLKESKPRVVEADWKAALRKGGREGGREGGVGSLFYKSAGSEVALPLVTGATLAMAYLDYLIGENEGEEGGEGGREVLLVAVFRNPHPPSLPLSLLPSLPPSPSDAGQAPPALHDEFFLLLLTALLSEQGDEEGGEEKGEEKEVRKGKSIPTCCDQF